MTTVTTFGRPDRRRPAPVPVLPVAAVAPVASSAILGVALGDAPHALAAVLALAATSSASVASVAASAAVGSGETWQQLVLRTQGKDVTRCQRCASPRLVRVDLEELDERTYARVLGIPRPRGSARLRRGRGRT